MIMAANPAMLPPPLPSHCRPPATLLWSEGHPSSTRGLPAPRLGLGHHLNPLFHHWNHCCSTTCYTTQLGLFQHHLRALQHSLWIRGHDSSPGELPNPRLSLDNHHNPPQHHWNHHCSPPPHSSQPNQLLEIRPQQHHQVKECSTEMLSLWHNQYEYSCRLWTTGSWGDIAVREPPRGYRFPRRVWPRSTSCTSLRSYK